MLHLIIEQFLLSKLGINTTLTGKAVSGIKQGLLRDLYIQQRAHIFTLGTDFGFSLRGNAGCVFTS